MRDLLKLSAKALAFGVLVLFACGIADMWQEFSAVRLLVRQSFGMEEFSVQMLGMIGTKFLALFYFEIAEGNGIYGHFGTASVYYFSRQMKKGRWFTAECGKLLLKCVIFSGIYLGAVGTILFLAKGGIEEGYFSILAYQTLVLSLWLYFNCLLMNALALLTDGVTGFFSVLALQAAEIGLLTLAASNGPIPIFWMVPEAELATHVTVMKLNPVFHLFLGWHSGDFKVLDALETAYHPLINFHAWESVCYFLVLSIAATIFGLFSVKKEVMLLKG